MLEVNGKHLLIPKAGIDALVDIESRGSLVARACHLLAQAYRPDHAILKRHRGPEIQGGGHH
jgi:hypothetical protein